MLQPCSISAKESQHPDESKYQYYIHMKVFSQANAFLTRNVLESYFNDVVFHYDAQIWSNSELDNQTAIILYDGLKDHISQYPFSQATELNIKIIVLPSHSSHILQPLDQRFFRLLKSIYVRFQKYTNVSQISTEEFFFITTMQ